MAVQCYQPGQQWGDRVKLHQTAIVALGARLSHCASVVAHQMRSHSSLVYRGSELVSVIGLLVLCNSSRLDKPFRNDTRSVGGSGVVQMLGAAREAR